MRFDLPDSVIALVPKPYAWFSAKPAISICSASKKGFGEPQLGHAHFSDSSSNGVFRGAVPGAAPVLIGYAALAGEIGPLGWALFATIFAWQFPHFMAIAWLYREDYARAGHRMQESERRDAWMAQVTDPEREQARLVSMAELLVDARDAEGAIVQRLEVAVVLR